MTASVTSPAGRAPDRLVALWLFGCAAMILAMVVIGGITRLTESGLSITRWEPLTGVIPPLTEAEWEESFALYRQIPEYRLVNRGMSLAEYKAIYWWEFVHRLWGRLIGIAFAVPLAIFLLRRRVGRALVPWLAVLLLLGALQGALGWYMVASGLSERIDVSQYRLAAHFSLAAALFAAVFWTALSQARPAPVESHQGARLKPWLLASLALLGLTMVAGAFVAGLDAGLVYNDFPWMGEGLVPPDYAIEDLSFPANAFENPAAAQFHHRLLAAATLAAVVALWWRGRKLHLTKPARMVLGGYAIAAAAQVGLGVLTIWLVVPIPIAALHQAGAMILLSLGLWAAFELREPATLRSSARA
ncbi:MAG: COX15/CtaA family protein [Rhodospirillales bacterium]|nr:COX15/CtaA family protein [Rhodospirillales bacterium]